MLSDLDVVLKIPPNVISLKYAGIFLSRMLNKLQNHLSSRRLYFKDFVFLNKFEKPKAERYKRTKGVLYI